MPAPDKTASGKKPPNRLRLAVAMVNNHSSGVGGVSWISSRYPAPTATGSSRITPKLPPATRWIQCISTEKPYA